MYITSKYEHLARVVSKLSMIENLINDASSNYPCVWPLSLRVLQYKHQRFFLPSNKKHINNLEKSDDKKYI